MKTFDCPKQFSVATVTFLDIFDVFRHEVNEVFVYSTELLTILLAC